MERRGFLARALAGLGLAAVAKAAPAAPGPEELAGDFIDIGGEITAMVPYKDKLYIAIDGGQPRIVTYNGEWIEEYQRMPTRVSNLCVVGDRLVAQSAHGNTRYLSRLS